MASKTSRPDIETKFARRMNLDVKVDQNGTRVQVVLPGLSYDDFDRTGNLAADQLIRKLQNGEAITWAKLSGKAHDLTEDTAMQFTVWSDYYLSRSLYTKALQQFDQLKLRWTSRLLGFGSISMYFESMVEDADTGELLARHPYAVAFVNRQTRRPIPVPQIIRDHFSHAGGKPEEYKERRSHLSMPPRTFQARIIVVPSEIDSNGHVNMAAYPRYCCNTAAMACYAKYYSNFHGDICNYFAKTVKILYIGECLPGDELTVHTWEDTQTSNIIYFKIMRNYAEITDCIMTFYKDDTSML